LDPHSGAILSLDIRRRENLTRLQEMQAERKELSKQFGQLKASGSGIPTELQVRLNNLKSLIPAGEKQAAEYDEQLDGLLAALPNLPAEDVPDGVDEEANVEVSRWGEQRNFSFDPKEHADLGPPLGLDFETGAAMSGARFTFLRGGMARLQRAIGQFMLDMQTARNGYAECAPPLLVRDEAVFGTGQLPKFADDLFSTELTVRQEDVETHYLKLFQAMGDVRDPESGAKTAADGYMLWRKQENIDRRWLIPTAEVSLTNSVREQIIDDLSQPIRLTALTPCFRSEAGAAGKDTRGFIRQHQFEKVELVTICREEDWQAEHEHMVKSAEGILEALDLPYRKMLLCAGDMGAGAKKTFDLEVWLPGQGAYREISSVSWCGEYQARRMNARYRPEGQKGTAFVHTLNGSGLAVGRTLVAVLENFQQEDGAVEIPAALVPYMGGMTKLEPLG
jgi:seryl-tRNA synthetase